MNDELETIVEDVEELEVLDGTLALTAVDRAAIDIQIATAKAYPRSVTKALQEAETLVRLDAETARSCFYRLPRGKDRDGNAQYIEGPSVRMAEIMAHSWGNLRIDADVVAIEEKWAVAMGTCFDLEKNVAVRVRVRRRITDRYGKRFNEDMIGVTSNAAISIAVRNAVFKVIPNAFTRQLFKKAQQASLGSGTMQEKRKKALDEFAKLKVKPDQLFSLLGIAGEDDIGIEHLITLHGLLTAINDGDTTVEQTFYPSAEKSNGAQELDQALKEKAEAGGDLFGGGEADKPATAKQRDALFARWNELVEEAGIDWVSNDKWSDSTFKKWLRSNDAPITSLTQAGVERISRIMENEAKQVVRYIEKERP